MVASGMERRRPSNTEVAWIVVWAPASTGKSDSTNAAQRILMAVSILAPPVTSGGGSARRSDEYECTACGCRPARAGRSHVDRRRRAAARLGTGLARRSRVVQEQ